MENKTAVAALSALAHENRLAVFRLLVQNGPDGLNPGVMAEHLAIPLPTLSFHLKTLAQAGLVSTVQEGRFIRYRADMAAFNRLTGFLLEDCCGGSLQACDCSPKGSAR